MWPPQGGTEGLGPQPCLRVGTRVLELSSEGAKAEKGVHIFQWPGPTPGLADLHLSSASLDCAGSQGNHRCLNQQLAPRKIWLFPLGRHLPSHRRVTFLQVSCSWNLERILVTIFISSALKGNKWDCINLGLINLCPQFSDKLSLKDQHVHVLR